MFLQKCKSLRFEDREKCLSNAREDSWFCAHHGEVAVCLALNRQWDEIINPENNYIDVHKHGASICEVEEYMHQFKMSILNGQCESVQYWWMQKNEKKKRVWGNCFSLELKTGDLCKSPVIGRERFCPYHKVQHKLLCAAYHLTTDMTMYGVSDNTRAFVEFMLRKEFSLIFIGSEDLGHRERRGWLLNQMFQDPYPEENRMAIDKGFYKDAERAYIVALRGMLCVIQIIELVLNE